MFTVCPKCALTLVVTATCEAAPDLGALLLRPDGHVAWVARAGHGADGLAEALGFWFGA